jgi:hypothetical protein
MYLVHAINSDRQHNCCMSSDRLQYINWEGGKKSCESEWGTETQKSLPKYNRMEIWKHEM